MALRFVMGMFEAPALPCLTLVTVMWYDQREQGIRVAIWSSTVASVSRLIEAHTSDIDCMPDICGLDLLWYRPQHLRTCILETIVPSPWCRQLYLFHSLVVLLP